MDNCRLDRITERRTLAWVRWRCSRGVDHDTAARLWAWVMGWDLAYFKERRRAAA